MRSVDLGSSRFQGGLSVSRVTVWTVGYSNRSAKHFVGLLKEHNIEVLVDVRSFPTSKVLHFKKDQMEKWLPDYRVEYVWLGKELGGYRRGGYEAHMKTELFGEGMKKLLEIAREKRACVMCLEPNPKHCHRRYISAQLERRGIEVVHILKKEQAGRMKLIEVLDENIH